MCKHKTWDELLAYPTVKIVKVKDRHLGCIRYLMMFLIFAYIIGYVIILDKGYNECIVPEGSISLSLLKPPGMIYPANYSYCTQNPNANISDPLQCMVVDERDVYQPVDQTNAMYIVTRFNRSYQQRNPECANGSACADPWIDMNTTTPAMNNKSYSAGIESFTIRFSHFFQARQFYMETHDGYYSQSCEAMNGKLENVNGEEIAKYGQDSNDIIALGDVLKAAGVDLNDILVEETGESNRHAGIVLFFGIDYNGNYDNAVTYTYSITQIPNVEYKVTRSTTIDEGQRMVINTHGVKIFFVFNGQICRFDFQTMLIQMVAGLGLLSVATLTTDFIMEYLMPLKQAYVRYKYKETEHHDTLRKRLTRKEIDTLEVSHDTESKISVNNQIYDGKTNQLEYRPLGTS